eukprot:4745514-Prymnesium_polylepis.1
MTQMEVTAPVGRLRVQKGGKLAAGHRSGVVREVGGAGFRDCAGCGMRGASVWGGRLCGAGGRKCSASARMRRCETEV